MTEMLDLTYFKDKLCRRKAELLVQLGQESEQELEAHMGRVSRMEVVQSLAMEHEIEQQRQTELKRIESALKRMEGGDFGICACCDNPIPPKRLEIDPSVALCVKCAEEV